MDDLDQMGESGAVEPSNEEDRFSVLEVFGLKLEVSNPRLAELLTMDARDALGTDVRDLVSSDVSTPVDRAAVDEAMPDMVVAPTTPKMEEDARNRLAFRQRAEAIGTRLGFATRSDGLWTSPSGISVVTRAVDKDVSLAAATHFVGEVSSHREALAGPDSTALFIVDTQQTADVFKVAIRQRRLYQIMRTITLDNLEQIAALTDSGALDHDKALVLLVPLENIDVGEVLSVIRAASGPQT